MNIEAFEADLCKLIEKYHVPHATIAFRDRGQLRIRSVSLFPEGIDARAATLMGNIVTQALLDNKGQFAALKP